MKNLSTETLEKQIQDSVGTGSLRCVGLGIDVEEIFDWKGRLSNEYFLKDNYSEQELAYCQKSLNPTASLAGLWCAKEAVLKSMSSFKPEEEIVREFGQNLNEVEVLHSVVGCPIVKLKGKLEQRRQDRGIREIKISISHSDQFASAIALAF